MTMAAARCSRQGYSNPATTVPLLNLVVAVTTMVMLCSYPCSATMPSSPATPSNKILNLAYIDWSSVDNGVRCCGRC